MLGRGWVVEGEIARQSHLGCTWFSFLLTSYAMLGKLLNQFESQFLTY